MKVFIHHARAILGPTGRGYCSRGMRLFAEKHGLNFEDFVKNGVDAEVLLATNDEMAKRAVEEAMKDG